MAASDDSALRFEELQTEVGEGPLSQHPASSMIVSAVVQIAHVLGMTVVAEGIETVKQHKQVKALGCDSCHCFYFARPAPADDIGALLRRRNAGGDLVPTPVA